jgi:hypothetical protein
MGSHSFLLSSRVRISVHRRKLVTTSPMRCSGGGGSPSFLANAVGANTGATGSEGNAAQLVSNGMLQNILNMSGSFSSDQNEYTQ